MKTVAGVFKSHEDAKHVARDLRERGLDEERLALMVPGEANPRVPVTPGEQPGMGKVIGGTVGAAAGAAGGLELSAALSAAAVPGVGPVLVGGILGAALLGTAGAAAGGQLEDLITEGLPEDELFVYKDALRRGRSVVVAVTADEKSAKPIRRFMKQNGAESLDSARDQWWIGVRDVEREHYSASGGDFQRDEVFYRLGFQSALHARTRGKEFDQVLNEMAQDIEELKMRHPGAEIEEPFRRGYERGRAYFESLRSK